MEDFQCIHIFFGEYQASIDMIYYAACRHNDLLRKNIGFYIHLLCQMFVCVKKRKVNFFLFVFMSHNYLIEEKRFLFPEKIEAPERRC